MLDGVGKTVRVAGMAGPPGESAYQAWRAAGNTGDAAVFLASLKGRDGSDGVDGVGTMVVRRAAVSILANTNVVDNGDGSVSPADPSNVAHCGKLVGLVQAPALAGASVSIALLGPLTGVTGAFSAGQRLWIGPGGICTATPPASGWRQSIGLAGASGNIVYEKGIAGLYDPSSPLVLLPSDQVGGERALAVAPISLHRCLKFTSGGVAHASSADLTSFGFFAGLSLAAAATGDGIAFAPRGLVSDPGWNWASGPVMLGLDGALTQVEPVSGFVQMIGISDAPTRLRLQPASPILIG